MFAYAGVLVGLGVSVWANVAHAMTPPARAPKDWPAGTPWVPATWHADPGALGMAGFWPLILFLALEVLTRTAWRQGSKGLTVARVGVGVVASVAAVVSYLHLHGLLDHYGEARVPALIGPLAIDGLMAVSTAALFAARPHRADTSNGEASTTADDEPSPHALAASPPATPAPSASPSLAGSSADSSARSSRPSAAGSSARSSRPSSARSSRPSAARSSRDASAGSSSRTRGETRPVDDETLRDLVAQARAERPGAGEPAVRRLLAEHGLSASAARVRAALTTPTPHDPVTGPGITHDDAAQDTDQNGDQDGNERGGEVAA